jgi:hypothetical protein
MYNWLFRLWTITKKTCAFYMEKQNTRGLHFTKNCFNLLIPAVDHTSKHYGNRFLYCLLFLRCFFFFKGSSHCGMDILRAFFSSFINAIEICFQWFYFNLNAYCNMKSRLYTLSLLKKQILKIRLNIWS